MADRNHWVVGIHAVEAVLSINPERALALYLVVNPANRAQQKIVSLAEQYGVPLHPVDKRSLSRQCGSEQHQGVALHARAQRERNEQQLKAFLESLSTPFLLILDQVQDPHNFGACLRTADAAGADAVIVAKDKSSPLTAVVQKVACGAAESMPIFRVTNLSRTIDSLKDFGIWIIGTSDRADTCLYQQDLSGPLALVMGAEGKGLRKLTEKKCDALLSLPMAGSVVSSLNVSVATGICLYEVVRQRRRQAAATNK